MMRRNRAAWIPGWYELDLLLAVGLTGDFPFWRVVPDFLRGAESLVFYNTIWHPEDVVQARGTIAAIRHPELGDVAKVDTRGLDYTFTLADGTELLVNAEEEPDDIYEKHGEGWAKSSKIVTDWRFLVEFDDLGELTPV